MGVKMRQPGLVAQKGVSSQEPCRAAGRSSLDARPYSGALFANRLRLEVLEQSGLGRACGCGSADPGLMGRRHDEASPTALVASRHSG
jgi:hypothetical protein